MSSFDLTGRVAVVTGGSRGIGRALAGGLRHAGAEVSVWARDESAVAATAEELYFRGYMLTKLELAQGRPGRAVRLAAAFKTVPAHLLGATAEPLDCDEFVCGDSDAARSEAGALVNLLPGLRAIDVGPLSRARSIEHLTALAIAINRRHKVHDARFRIVGL